MSFPLLFRRRIVRWGALPVLFAERFVEVMLFFPVIVLRCLEPFFGSSFRSGMGVPAQIRSGPFFAGRLSIILWITIENPSIICE